MTPICLVGIGKIARDQHVPAINTSPDFTLAATVSRSGTVKNVPAYDDFDLFLKERSDIPVVSLCLPPVPRFDIAVRAMRAGRHVMLEKPPGANLAQVHTLTDIARTEGVSLYTTWHSRMAPGVAPAQNWLKDKQITGGTVTWKEDVRRWHPGQEWVFAPGGMGVFDPGINALSILTAIMPDPLHLRRASLEIPANRDMPIAAALEWDNTLTANFDWRQQGDQMWDIALQTNAGSLLLQDGGHRLTINGTRVNLGGPGEYPALYAEMANLVRNGASNIDPSPMIQVADAFTLATRKTVAAFDF